MNQSEIWGVIKVARMMILMMLVMLVKNMKTRADKPNIVKETLIAKSNKEKKIARCEPPKNKTNIVKYNKKK